MTIKEENALEEADFDGQKSVFCHCHPHFVSYFAMDLENAFQPRCIVIDRNRYKVYIEHFEAGNETRKHIAARI